MRRKDREVTDRPSMLDMIARADSCRLAMIDITGATALPYIVALNYGFSAEPDRFWFHCAKVGRKIDILRANNRVCLQLDLDHELKTGPAACDWGMYYGSLVAEGHATIVDDPAEQRFGLDCLMKHFARDTDYGDYDAKHLGMTAVIRLDVSSMSAKRKPLPAS